MSVRAAGGDKSGGGEDSVPPSTESLFMQELRRRGVDSSSVSVDDDASTDTEAGADGGSPFTIKGTPSNPFGGGRGQAGGASEQAMEDQLNKSRKLNSEGLEGLIPRATELLRLGGGQFLAFLPFMAVFSLLFTVCFYVLGPSFIHGGSDISGPPPYVDPQMLLDEPTYDPTIPLR